MKRIILLALLFPLTAFSQAVRVDIPLLTSGPNVPNPGTALPAALWLTNPTVQICAHPATLSSCTYVTTYTDSTATVTCPATQQLTQLPSPSTCSSLAGTLGNVGFWYAGGTVDYIVTSSYGTFGPYTVTGLSGSGNFVSLVQTLPQTMAGPLNAPIINNVVNCSTSSTVAACIALLPVGGGIVMLQEGTYQSGTIDLTTANISIIGSGRPTYDSLTAPTKLVGGSIIQGSFHAHQGANNLVLRNLGVDNGSAYVSGGGTANDAIGIYNSGQTIGAPQVQNPIIQNVSCLGSSTTASFHCLLVENVNNAIISNIQAVDNTHGVVLKGTNSKIDGVWSAGHSQDAIDIKSDPYAINHNDAVTNFSITDLATPGDTGGLVVNSEVISSNGSANYAINISNGAINTAGTTGNPSGLQLFSQGESFPVTDVNISNVSIDWPGGSTGGYACIIYSGSVARINMNNINCKNYYYAIFASFPDAIIVNDYVLTGSQFYNIASDAIQTNGRWSIIGNSFNAITGNAVLAQTGTTTLGDNVCTSCGAYFNKTSGIFDFDFRAYATNSSSAQTVSPAILGNIQSMTSGQLVVNFLNTFNGTPDCTATPVSSNAAGTPAPTVWIAAVSSSGVTINASSSSFAGQVHWMCLGSFN